jgi:hypothetical protein
MLSMMRWKSITCLVYCWLLVGCATATPDPNPPLIGGVDALPKQLATVYVSPTPALPDVQATQIRATLDSALPTATLIPATLTPTTTPYVGIFLGVSTFSPGDVLNQRPLGTRSPRQAAVSQPGVAPVGIPTVAVVGSFPTPITGASNPVSAGACPTPPAAPFVNAAQNPLVRQQLGCPTAAAYATNMVQQSFQKGVMIWRDTRQIYALSTAAIQQNASVDTLWVLADQWNDSLPASDGAFTPPDGLLQPVRGFGYVWRNTQAIRDALGWALAGEQPYQGTWQDFERGWMLTGADGRVYAMSPGNPTGLHFGPLP